METLEDTGWPDGVWLLSVLVLLAGMNLTVAEGLWYGWKYYLTMTPVGWILAAMGEAPWAEYLSYQWAHVGGTYSDIGLFFLAGILVVGGSLYLRGVKQ